MKIKLREADYHRIMDLVTERVAEGSYCGNKEHFDKAMVRITAWCMENLGMGRDDET